MTKIRKVKRRKSYKVNINRKRLRNKLRKLPAIECKDIKDAWEDTKSIRHNLGDMGLAYDANEALKIPNFKGELIAKARNKLAQNSSPANDESEAKRVPSKLGVAASLEADAKAPRERNFRLPNQQVQFVTYLMDKYDEDYKSMARDKKNYYQLTWRQIRAKINSFKSVPEQYAEYLLKKGDIILEDPEPLMETRKRTAMENVAKYCARKIKKVKETSQWLEESVEEFDCGDKLENIEEIASEEIENSEKKLKLFSDDDDDDEESENENKKKKLCGKASAKVDDLENRKKKENMKMNEGNEKAIGGKVSRMKFGEKMESDDSEEELEGSEDSDEAGFVNLTDLSDEELSDDDVLDNGEFVTDSEEESD